MPAELSTELLSRVLLPPNSDSQVLNFKLEVLERPLGGSGDSCVVSRLLVTTSVRPRSEEVEGRNKIVRTEESLHRAIVKEVTGPSQRHGGFDSLKAEIKRQSYKIEGSYLASLNSDPSCVTEDLVEKGFRGHVGELNLDEALIAMRWLAEFHYSSRYTLPGRVWARGTYWSLEKRSEEYRKIRSRWTRALEDEETRKAFKKLPNNLALRLERSAHALDQLLHPDCKSFPFSIEEERRAYDTVDVDFNEDDGRDPERKSLTDKVQDGVLSSLTTNLPKARLDHFLLRPVVVHGDFKGENIFFSETQCAVCDFQWVGFGIGVLDIVPLVYASIEPSLENPRSIERLLDEYLDSLARSRKIKVTKDDRRLFSRLFDWAVVDYSRYVVGTGMMYPEDTYFLTWADRILSSIDRGIAFSKEREYTDHILNDIRRCI